jgi:hypothetical protein
MLNPVHFLIGAERSGTTLLRLMLDHHPEIAWCSEFEYSVDPMGDGADFPETNRYIAWLERDRIFRLHGWQIDRGLDYPHLMDSFLQQKLGGKSVIGATVHRHFPRLLKIWPHARFIYLLRDGRDVAKSTIGMGVAGNMWSAMDRWMMAEKLWDELRASLPEDRWIEVRYEELIAEPVQGLTRICRFLGVNFDQAMFDYVHTTQTYGLPDPKLSQQWRKKLSPEEIRQAEAKAGALLQARGYELSGLPPLEVTATLERKLRRQDRLERLNYRIDRFGLWLVLGETVSRRLRMELLERYCAERIDQITNAHMKR